MKANDGVEYTFGTDGKLKTKKRIISNLTIEDTYTNNKISKRWTYDTTNKISITEQYNDDGTITRYGFNSSSGTSTQLKNEQITINFDGTETRYNFDNNGNITSKTETVTDSSGKKTTTTTEYDPKTGKTTKTTVEKSDPTGTTTSKTETVVDGNKTTVTELDPNTNNPTKTTVTEVDPKTGNPTKTTVTELDSAGNPTKTTVTEVDGNKTTVTEYDASNNPTKTTVTEVDSAGNPTKTTVTEVDSAGKTTVQIYDGDATGTLKETRIETQFDVDGGKGTRIEIYEGDPKKGKIKNTIIETPDLDGGKTIKTYEGYFDPKHPKKSKLISTETIVSNSDDLVTSKGWPIKKKTAGTGLDNILEKTDEIVDLRNVKAKKLNTADDLLLRSATQSNYSFDDVKLLGSGKAVKTTTTTVGAVFSGLLDGFGVIGDIMTGFTLGCAIAETIAENTSNGRNTSGANFWKWAGGVIGGVVFGAIGTAVTIFAPGWGNILWSGIGMAADAATLIMTNRLNQIDEQKKTLI